MPKSGHTAVNIGQYIIYFGGWDQTTGKCDDSLHVLHTTRREWNKPLIQGTLPTPRHSHAGCSVGTVMYVFGGQVDNFYLGDIAAFDMKTITQNPRWEIIEPQSESPPARSGHCAGVHDGKIYIFGGADADYFYNDIWCFDPRTNTWTPIPASGYLPTGRHCHSCAIVDGVMYVFGGNSPDGREMNDAYAFRIQERRWYLFQNVGPAASPRSGHAMCAIKDKIFVIGGDSDQGLQDDPSQVYYLEIPKIRFPDSSPQPVPPRQVNSAKLTPNRLGAASPQPFQQPSTDIPSDNDNDRNSGPTNAPGRPDRRERPARAERPMTQRPTSPATFATTDRQGPGSSNLSISQQTSSIPPPSHPTNRSPSPATGRAYARGTPTPPPQLAVSASAQVDAATPSPADMARYKQLESKAEEAQEANERLQEQMKERDEELALMRNRENWLVAEVMLARQLTGASKIENSQLEGHQLKITKALLKVKEELRNAKMLIATQAQAASLKIKEAERIRTGALQEAAYLKAKLSALSNAHQDPDSLARVEMDRAADLEKRLTTALSEMEILESQCVKSQEFLQQEKQARLSAEERSNGSSVLAEQAQAAHTRALAELASLHGRAAKAEAESRDFATHSLKVLHKNSQTSASRSASELADAMIELSRLEQSSMQARAESISLQRLLADEREGNSELRNELSKTELDLENKLKELENNEVQLGLLKDVMREK
ncbi:hypothetical protein EDD21DRAFT_328471, partial [Dissophora ornata]